MAKLYHLLRKYPFSATCIIVIWYLSFFTPPKTEMEEVPFIDKWVHIAMYGGTCIVMWTEYIVKHHYITTITKRLLSIIWCAPIVMSGIIELLQEYCTNGRRSGDWLDLAANSLGVSLAAIVGMSISHYLTKRNRDKHEDESCNNGGCQ